MRLHRFYVSQPLGEDVVIEEVSLLKQWVKVFRYTQGDFVILFNGDGCDHHYTLKEIQSKKSTLSLIKTVPTPMPLRRSFLYFACIKKDAFESVAQKSVELGITDIVPITTEHTEKKNLDYRRLESIIKEAAEQSGRGDMPVIHESITFKDILESLSQHTISSSFVFFFTLFGDPWQTLLTAKEKSKGDGENTPIACLVGPEGGWSPEEELFAKEHSFRLISLGTTTLRADTAGIVSSFLSKLL